jgi:type II secretory pathway pseudopilin PulG
MGNSRFNPSSKTQQGLSLVELLITVIISTVILSVSLGLIVTQRRQYLNARANTDTNQTLQVAMDMIGTDIRQVGEKIDPSLRLPVIQIEDGSAGDPDTLVLQRKLLAIELSVCKTTVSGSPAVITVADKTLKNCTFQDAPSKDASGTIAPPDGVPDNVAEWQKYRCGLDKIPGCQNPSGNCQQTGGTNPECSWAYIYDPTNGYGEFFLYTGEVPIPNSSNPQQYQIQIQFPGGPKLGDPPSFARSYPFTPAAVSIADEPKLYIFEQRTYRLSEPDTAGDRTLQLTQVDPQTNIGTFNQPYDLVSHLRNFQVQGIDAAGAFIAPFNETLPYTDWQTLQAIEVQLDAPNRAPNAVNPIKTLTSQFFPRNSLSSP